MHSHSFTVQFNIILPPINARIFQSLCPSSCPTKVPNSCPFHCRIKYPIRRINKLYYNPYYFTPVSYSLPFQLTSLVQNNVHSGNKMPSRGNRGFYCLKLENHSTKYHRQQPLYNTLELLMMGIVVPETC